MNITHTHISASEMQLTLSNPL